MTDRIVSTERERESILALLKGRGLPFTIRIAKGKNRSVEQNKLQRLWLREAAEQLCEYTAEEYRGYCKLHFGVAILRNESDKFREVYDRLIRPRSYEEKLELMMVPMDLPVTRIMTTKQKTTYLDDMYVHFTGLGVILTEPKSER